MSDTPGTGERYVALLRGVNVGGRTMKMTELRAGLEALGFEDVRTLLASGNVVFTSPPAGIAELTDTIGDAIEQRFGYRVSVIIRPLDAIARLVDTNPFKDVPVMPATRLYVSFLPQPVETDLKLPYVTADGSLRILQATASEVASVVTLTPTTGTLDAMSILEGAFGKDITTRNWNTVCKLLK